MAEGPVNYESVLAALEYITFPQNCNRLNVKKDNDRTECQSTTRPCPADSDPGAGSWHRHGVVLRWRCLQLGEAFLLRLGRRRCWRRRDDRLQPHPGPTEPLAIPLPIRTEGAAGL